MKEIESASYYGQGYEDVTHRRPSIANAMKRLGWRPVVPLQESVERTLDFFLRDHIASLGPQGSTETPALRAVGAVRGGG